mgnify:CR=1 FL=1|tara:strand:- start:1479 stop:2642 length:1164 start_codon:yes stop_codon:yes gene_type:complete
MIKNTVSPIDGAHSVRVLMVAGLASSLTNFRGPLIKAMIARGHDVHVAAPGLSTDTETVGWLSAVGATGHDIDLARAGLSPVSDIKSLFQLYRLMRRIRPGLFIGYTIKPVIWGLLAAGWARVPRRVGLITGLGYAFTQADSAKRRVIRGLVHFLYRRALRQSTLVFFQNPDDAAEFRALRILTDRQRAELVNGSGVDTDQFAQVPMPPLPLRFLFVGRIIVDKGIREFAEAAKRIRARHPDVSFDVVGGLDSNPTALPEAEVQGWVSDGRLNWHGALPDVRPSIAQSHVLILPSYREGTPRSVLEAMAVGRAVITTDAPGCRETVEVGRNGLLVPVRDVDGLVAAIESMIAAPQTVIRMGQEGRDLAVTRYDVHQVNAAMLAAMGL